MTAREHAYAGFWIRAAARLIDFLVILGIYNFFYVADNLGASAGLWPPADIDELWHLAGRVSPEIAVRGLFFFGFPVFYYVFLHGAYGQTFGKMAFRILVINEDGTPLGFKKAFLRWLAYFLCVFTLYLGYLWAAFDRRKQGLHDRVCRTLVVRT
ncbi:MAG TPA: RDD family protein [Candidatus Deferrimicrobiaceae bacterium]